MAEEVERAHELAVAAQREYASHERSSSLSQLLLAPVGHMGDMGPWGLDSGPVYMGGHSTSGRNNHRAGTSGQMGTSNFDPQISQIHAQAGGLSINNSQYQLPPIQDIGGFADPLSSGIGGGSGSGVGNGNGNTSGNRQFRSPTLPGTSSIAPELRSMGLHTGFGREPTTTSTAAGSGSGGYGRHSISMGSGLGTGDRAVSMLPSPDARSASFSMTDGSDKGKAREEWHKTGAGAVLVCPSICLQCSVKGVEQEPTPDFRHR